MRGLALALLTLAVGGCTEADRRGDDDSGSTELRSEAPDPDVPLRTVPGSDPDAGPEPSIDPCADVGEPCDCGDGRTGERVCTDAGVGGCFCTVEQVCWPAQVLPCDCEGGGSGTAVCNAEGTEVGECTCEEHLAEGYEVPDAIACAIQRRCSTCHSDPLANGAPMPLVTWEDFHGPSPSQPEVPVYIWLADRVGRDDALRMPPPGSRAVSGVERERVLDWVQQGAPPAGPPEPEPDPGPDPDQPIPNDVLNTLRNFCWGCHGEPLVGGAPMSLLAVEDFLAPSPSDPDTPVYDAVLDRMQRTDGTHMPASFPAPLGPPWIDFMRAWIERTPFSENCEPLL